MALNTPHGSFLGILLPIRFIQTTLDGDTDMKSD